jgi:hypothetical protein
MNFSFSDVKTSVDKSILYFDRNMQILYTEVMPNNILERISQEDEEDHETCFRRQRIQRQSDVDNVQYESQGEDEDFATHREADLYEQQSIKSKQSSIMS